MDAKATSVSPVQSGPEVTTAERDRAWRIVLVDDVPDHSFAPLLERRPFALLPVLDRRLIDWVLGVLAEAGVAQVEIATSDRCGLVAAHVADGSRWGLRIVVRQGDDPAMAFKGDVGGHRGEEDLLVLRTSVMPDVGALRTLLSERFDTTTDLYALGRDCVVGRVLPATERTAPRDAMPIARRPSRMMRGAILLGDVQAYWRLNLLLLRTHGSRLHREQRFGEAVFVAPAVSVHESAELEEPCRIGPRSRIMRGAVVGRDTVVFRDVVIGEGVELREAMVLPGTLVGARLSLRRKIVDGPWLIDIESGAAVHVADPSMLSAADARDERVVERVGLRERATALLGLTCAATVLAPLVLLRGLLGRTLVDADSVTVAAGRSLDGVRIRQQLATWRLAFGPRRLRVVPRLWLVARGRIGLDAALQP